MIYENLQRYLSMPEEERDKEYRFLSFAHWDWWVDDFLRYEPIGNEIAASRLLTEYIYEEYGVKPYKCVTFYGRESRVNCIVVYFNTCEEDKMLRRLTNESLTKGGYARNQELKEKTRDILLSSGFPDDQVNRYGTNVLFCSFEELAVNSCYNQARAELMELKKALLNPETMEEKGFPLFYVYKNQQLLEEGKQNGEQDRIREEAYKVIKKHDKYNVISRTEHFDVLFLNSDTYYPHWQTDLDLMEEIKFNKK